MRERVQKQTYQTVNWRQGDMNIRSSCEALSWSDPSRHSSVLSSTWGYARRAVKEAEGRSVTGGSRLTIYGSSNRFGLAARAP